MIKIRSFLRISSHLLKKSLMENFILQCMFRISSLNFIRLLGLLQVKKRNLWSYKSLCRNKAVTFKNSKINTVNSSISSTDVQSYLFNINVIHSIKDFDPIQIEIIKPKYSFPLFKLSFHSVKCMSSYFRVF